MTMLAIGNLPSFGGYPASGSPDSTEHVEERHNDAPRARRAVFDRNDVVKRHSACDECRKRKLKCSREPEGCTRCIKQRLRCHYSQQKQMGRPRKRPKTEDGKAQAIKGAASSPRPIRSQACHQPSQSTSSPDKHPSSVDGESTIYENNLVPDPVIQSTKGQQQALFQSSLDVNSECLSMAHTSVQAPVTTNIFDAQYPLDVAEWPDFSNAELPLPFESKWRESSPGRIDPDADPGALNNLPAVPACPCLPNLYLTLSTIATLTSFPFNRQTITTIETAYMTAKAVIYCPVCPQQFNTGSQNLMLATTLVTVLADQWRRLRKLSVLEVMQAFGLPDQDYRPPTTKQGKEWRDFANSLIRAYVFGDEPIPLPPGTTMPETMHGAQYPELTLLDLAQALRRRQRQWHSLDEATDEFPDRVTPDLTHGHIVGGNASSTGEKFLCLEIVAHAMCIIRALHEPGCTMKESAVKQGDT